MIYPNQAASSTRKTWWKVLRQLTITLAAAAFCALLYLRFVPSEAPPAPVREASVDLKPKILRLSALIDGHIDSIFSPLDAKVPPTPHQELRILREAFADGARASLPSERPLFTTAVRLCDVLLRAIQEREKAALSLADSRSKPHSTALSNNSRREEGDRRGFFEFNINKRWVDNSVRYRADTIQLYSQLREQERHLLLSNSK